MSPYHHGNLRQALVEEAIALAAERGPDGVVIREVARRAAVSHNAAYRHFADREDLLAEVAAQGMADLADTMRSGIAAVTDPDPQRRARSSLRAVGRSYVDFAFDHPGLFAVAFSSIQARPVEGGGPYDVLSGALDQCVAAGIIDPARRPGAELGCWAAVHGFARLHSVGPLAATPEAERLTQLEIVLQRLDESLGIVGQF